jgi:hypothetical protein
MKEFWLVCAGVFAGALMTDFVGRGNLWLTSIGLIVCAGMAAVEHDVSNVKPLK